jgi:GT2 family glycosyltransferase
VGTFNPYLYSEEEPELCLRIRQAGYFVLLFDQPIVRHYDDAQDSVSRVLGRRKRKFHLGMGQAARYHLGSKLFWPWMKERWWEPAAALLLASGLGALLLSTITRDFIWFGSWILAFALLFFFVALRKRSFRGALVAAFNWVVMAEGFLNGFLTEPTPPTGFSGRIETVGGVRNQLPALTEISK